MNPLQFWITTWHMETFGSDCPIERVQAKLREEVGEYLEPGANLKEELADIVICCFRLASYENVDLLTEVQRKFKIVEKRKDQIRRDKERGIE